MTTPVPIEVELKYQVADLAIGERLLGSDRLGKFVPDGEIRVAEHDDRYLDTPEGVLEAARMAVRLRVEGDQTTLTVKSPGSVEGALRRREELEGPADTSNPPTSWPPSAARDRLLELIGDRPLHELVTIRQFRRKRDFVTAEATVELSLDEVRIVVDHHTVDRFIELEAELTRGPEDALGPLIGLLDGRPGLSPTVSSKLARALEAAATARAETLAPPGEIAGVAAPEAETKVEPKSEPAPEAKTKAKAAAKVQPEPVAEPVAEAEPGPVAEAEAGPNSIAEAGSNPIAEAGSNPIAAPAPPPPAGSHDLGSDPDELEDASDSRVDEAVDEPGDEADDELLPIVELPHASDDPLDLPDLAEAEPEVEVRAARSRKGGEIPEEEPVVRLATSKNPGVAAEDFHSEAGRKVLRFHLARMLEREAGTREGSDPEELHGMRVATRRMRAAWRVFGDAYRPARTRLYRRRLRELAGLLGAVRDLDVLIEATEAYGDAIGRDDRKSLEPLLATWRGQRETARERLLERLDSRGYARFIEDFVDFVSTPGRDTIPAEATAPHRVRDTAASRIWTAYEHVRAYEAVLRWADVATLHQLRIAAKRLRYTIEFVREPLGPDAAPLIARIVNLQDHLGFMNDAEVAATMARTFLVEHGNELSEAEAEAIGRYLVSREREVARLKRTVGSAWRGVAGVYFRRALGRTIAGL